MSGHTPGPWRAERGVIVADVPNHGFTTSAVAYYGDEWRHSGGLQYAEERDANGNLIAAAPDLLDACTVALGHMTGGMDGDWRDCDPAELLRAAILKARQHLKPSEGSGGDLSRSEGEG